MDNYVEPPELSTGQEPWYDCLLLVFAKQPQPGQVKTRLTPPLTPTQAATLYGLSQRQTLASLRQAPFRTVLCYSGDDDYFRRHYPWCPLLDQGQGDLGQRLQRAFKRARQAGWRRVCVIGTDSPDLPLALIFQAFEQLQRHDFVVIPAADGGYVLAGASVSCDCAFEEIHWSSAQVLEQTCRRLTAAGLSYRQLEAWQDIDDEAALVRFIQRSPASACGRYGRRCLRSQAAQPINPN